MKRNCRADAFKSLLYIVGVLFQEPNGRRAPPSRGILDNFGWF
jgi:hypothetical protein